MTLEGGFNPAAGPIVVLLLFYSSIRQYVNIIANAMTEVSRNTIR